MYTEENEFDYDDYGKKNNGGFINKDLIIKIVLIVICLLIIIFLVFKVKNLNNKGNNNNNNSNSPVLVFNNNIEMLRNAGEDYFFTKRNMPKEVGDTVTVSIKELKNGNYVTDVLDYDGGKCGYNTSYVSVTKNSNDYLMKINLVCSSMEDSVEYYYDLKFNCLTCNGEDYTPSDNNTVDDNKNNNSDNNNNNNDNNNNNNNNNNNTAVCGNYGEWTTEFKNDPSLEYETRVLIKAYKTEKIYGEYSTPTKTKPEEQTGIEIKSYETTETTSEYTDWTTTNEKPEDKTGREIKTSTENTPYSSKSCKNVTTTYTKKITGTDKKAIKCSAVKGEYMKYVCTYKKTEKKCSTTTKYKTTTTYTYRDLVEKQQQVTYYQTRTVTDNTVYTNYILESEIPSGYIKLNGSEITQYRYRQVCSK